ncbi:MAG: hypothetical protein WB523_03525 [Candidatus Sulfotelmatobacter sp.]
MKNAVCLALVVLAVLPAAAQKPASATCSTNVDTVAALGEDYAARVDGLLREVHASLQKISERTEAGELTPEQARELKLAATRDMISRLDTISAVYDARLDSKNKICADTGSEAGNTSAARSALHAGTGTISVEELKRETAGTAAVPSAERLLDECD